MYKQVIRKIQMGIQSWNVEKQLFAMMVFEL